MLSGSRAKFHWCTRAPSKPGYQILTYVVWSKENTSCYPHQDSMLICDNLYETKPSWVWYSVGCRRLSFYDTTIHAWWYSSCTHMSIFAIVCYSWTIDWNWLHSWRLASENQCPQPKGYRRMINYLQMNSCEQLSLTATRISVAWFLWPSGTLLLLLSNQWPYQNFESELHTMHDLLYPTGTSCNNARETSGANELRHQDHAFSLCMCQSLQTS